MMKPRSLLLGTSLFAVLATGAIAQEADPARETFLGTITITGTENPKAPTTGFVARSSATTKTGTPILETPYAISVITRDQMDAQGARNLSEAFGYSAGIVTENYGADPRFDSLYLRGFNLENDKFLDGLRLMRSTQYPTSAPAFELYGLERVEVLRGPASLLYGSGTPAGLVNMIQKRAQADGDFTELGFEADSNGSFSAFGDANRVVDDRFAYRITAKAGNTKTDVEEIDNKRAYLGLSASYLLTDSTELEFMASHHDDEPITPTGVPSSLVGQVDGRDLRDFYFGDRSIDDSDRKMTTLSFGLTHDFGNGWKLNNTFRYTKFDWTYHSMYLDAASGTLIDRGIITQREKFESWGTDLRLSGGATTGAVNHALTFGLDAQKFKESAYTGFSTADAIDYANPSRGGLGIGDPWYTADKDVDASQVGLYALDEMSMGNWRATVGLRHEWTDQSGGNVTNYGTTDYARDDRQATGHASLGYLWEGGLFSYLSYGTSYLPQPGFDIDGKVLKPTHGKQWELGLKYEPTAFDGLFTAALYDLRETDRNTSVEKEVDGGTITGTRQIGEARVRGLELEGTAGIGEGWSLKGAYTWTITNITGDDDGNELANTPRHAASLWLQHSFTQGALDGLTLGGGLRHIGERWSSDANTEKLDSVTLLDLGASYEFSEGVIGRLNINNVMDELYISAVGLNSSYYGDGRTVTASLSYKW
ncbi:TonB-dependent siderophore receptor [Sinirhodobacter populi]|uniref:TonB-dependent siderophore receptor n=1 Tax=Paenirhodobacter populi TaxID=2306993 RepID=A0A443K0S1_9RHOB|nr:TonB-dependent siderophore receptor [Sinirhodobacter populi]RWR26309.1 TonB-dependent siderophore receptor [Sinirhodobacter populi]